jgi:hypothetical protein
MGELLHGLDHARRAASEAGVLAEGGGVASLLERFSQDLRTTDGELGRLVARLETQGRTGEPTASDLTAVAVRFRQPPGPPVTDPKGR